MAEFFKSMVLMHRYQDKILRDIISDFSIAEWSHQIGASNSALWLVGHLAACRLETFRIIGGRHPEETWEMLFHEGHPPTPSTIVAQNLVDEFDSSGVLLCNLLLQLTASDAQLETAHEWLPGSKTIEGFMNYRFWHESYHVGQLGIIRRVLKPLRK